MEKVEWYAPPENMPDIGKYVWFVLHEDYSKVLKKARPLPRLGFVSKLNLPEVPKFVDMEMKQHETKAVKWWTWAEVPTPPATDGEEW